MLFRSLLDPVAVGANADLCTGELRLTGRHDANADNVSDSVIYLTSPYAAPTTVRSMIEGYTCVAAGGPWGSSTFYYTFPNDTIYPVTYTGGTWDDQAEKPVYHGAVSLRVAGTYLEKKWPFRLDPIDAASYPPTNVQKYVAGGSALLTWAGALPPQTSYTIGASTNGGTTWSTVASGVTATSHAIAPGTYNPNALYGVRVGTSGAYVPAAPAAIGGVVRGTTASELVRVRRKAGETSLEVVIGANTYEYGGNDPLIIDSGLGNDTVCFDYINGDPFAPLDPPVPGGDPVRRDILLFNSGGSDGLTASGSSINALGRLVLTGGTFTSSVNLGTGRPLSLVVEANAALTFNTTQNLAGLSVAGTVVGTLITAGSYELTGGSLTTYATTIASSGSFTQSGGVHTVLNPWTVSERYTLSGGWLRVGALGMARNLTLNHAGEAKFVQTGGSVEVNGSLILASAAGTQARYELLGGSLTAAGSITIGSAGAATFVQGLANLSGPGDPPANVGVTLGAGGVFDYADAGYQHITLTQQAWSVYRHIPAPALPANFTAEFVSGEELSLEWDDVPDNHFEGTDYTRYRIDRKSVV